ncbi:MAG: AIR carboxylase family protein [Candidatus Norongarragalinales archaeon]
MKNRVYILMGSKSDLPNAEKVGETLKEFGVEYDIRVASAHRTPAKVMGIVEEVDNEAVVLVGVVGLSNALSGMLAGISTLPVITLPTTPEDVMASLRMPPGVAHATVLDPKNAALMAVKILALQDASLKKKVREFLSAQQERIEKSDAEVRR